MKAYAYAHFLEKGEFRAGLNLGNGIKRFRLKKRPASLIIHAYIRIHIRDTVPRTPDSFCQVIDEAFATIGTPDNRTHYERTTASGRFEFATRQSYLGNASEAKGAIAKVFDLIPDRPSIK